MHIVISVDCNSGVTLERTEMKCHKKRNKFEHVMNHDDAALQLKLTFLIEVNLDPDSMKRE